MKSVPTNEKSPAHTKQAQDRPTATVSNEEKGYWFRYPYEKDPEFIPHPNPDELTEKGKESYAFSYRLKEPNKESPQKKGFWYRQPFTKTPVFVPHPHPEKLNPGDLAIHGKNYLESLERAKFVSPYPFPDQSEVTETEKENQRIPGSGFFYKPNGAAAFYFIPHSLDGEKIPKSHEEQREYGKKWLSSPAGMLAGNSLLEEKGSNMLPTHIHNITNSINFILMSDIMIEPDKEAFEHVSNAVMYLTRLSNYYNSLMLD